MRSGNQGNVIDVVELGGDLGSKQPSSASGRHSPCFDVLWIGPHEIAEWTLMRDLHSSVNKSHLVDGLDLRREASVDAEDFTFDNSTDAEVVEDLGAVLPRIGISVFSNGLVVETIHGGDLSCLVVSSQQGDVSGVLQLQTQQQLEGFHRVESSIHKVPHEDVSRVWNISADVEKMK